MIKILHIKNNTLIILVAMNLFVSCTTTQKQTTVKPKIAKPTPTVETSSDQMAEQKKEKTMVSENAAIVEQKQEDQQMVQPKPVQQSMDTIEQDDPTPKQDKQDRLALMEALKNELAKRIQERMQQNNTGEQTNIIEQDRSETTTLPDQAEAPQTEAERQAMERAERRLHTEVTGLVIDQTISPFGSYFYHKFYISFQPPIQISQEYNVYITEQASPSFGFILRVKVDEYTIWGKNLKPRLPEIEDAVDEALQRVQNFLVNYEQMLKQLGGNDMVGDGIM